jgi:hypothetical protein
MPGSIVDLIVQQRLSARLGEIGGPVGAESLYLVRGYVK